MQRPSFFPAVVQTPGLFHNIPFPGAGPPSPFLGCNARRPATEFKLPVTTEIPMANTVLLNNIDHRDLKVITRHSPEFGDNVNQVQTFPTEFGDVQREYPIFFRKDPETGEFQAVALLGLDKGENLFLDETGWHARYIPAIMARGPFMIGFQEQEVDGELRKEPMIHVDLDDPRVNETEGEPVFLPQGGNSPYLERVGNSLKRVYDGLELNKPMFELFDAAGLIEPVTAEIKLSETEQYTVQHYYTISQAGLAQLDGDNLEKLNKAGFLGAAFMVLNSLANVSRLIDLKNRRRARQDA